MIVQSGFIQAQGLCGFVTMRFKEFLPFRKSCKNRRLLANACAIRAGKHDRVGILGSDEINIQDTTTLCVLIEKLLISRGEFIQASPHDSTWETRARRSGPMVR